MEWADIRAHYKRMFEAAKRTQKITQKSVAQTGGLKGQNRISKVLHNRKRGPAVDTFVGAVIGLGIPLSEFFRTLEEQLQHGKTDDVAIETEIAKLLAARNAVVHRQAFGHSSWPSGETTLEKFARLEQALSAFFGDLEAPPRAVRRKRARPRRS